MVFKNRKPMPRAMATCWLVVVWQDESEEAKAMNRIANNLGPLCEAGMKHFVADVLPLPLEFHPKFTQAKARLATDGLINPDSSVMQVLQRVSELLREAIPSTWISFAADVSELHDSRLDFVNGSGQLFSNRKDLLERFLSIRAYYTLSVLRDLASLKKTNFSVQVNLLISSLHVDLGALMERSAKKGEIDRLEREARTAEKDQLAATLRTLPKPHPVAPLVLGFDVLQSYFAA